MRTKGKEKLLGIYLGKMKTSWMNDSTHNTSMQKRKQINKQQLQRQSCFLHDNENFCIVFYKLIFIQCLSTNIFAVFLTQRNRNKFIKFMDFIVAWRYFDEKCEFKNNLDKPWPKTFSLINTSLYFLMGMDNFTL